jgi:hypothetical protein
MPLYYIKLSLLPRKAYYNIPLLILLFYLCRLAGNKQSGLRARNIYSIICSLGLLTVIVLLK